MLRSIVGGSAVNWEDIEKALETDVDKEIHRLAQGMADVELSEKEMDLLTKIKDGRERPGRIRAVYAEEKRVYIPQLPNDKYRLLAGLLIDGNQKQ